MLEMRTIGYRGRSTGVSVRQTKGVWVRQSGSRGTPQRGLVPTSSGTLVTTDRRIVFTGTEKSIAIPFEKIAFLEPLLDGVRLSNGNKTFTFLTEGSHSNELFLAIAQRLLRQRTSVI